MATSTVANQGTTVARDATWIRQAFLVQSSQLQAVDLQNRTFTSASLKFTDTTPGGNFAINAPPQFTRSADIKNMGIYKNSKGMGRYYSEAIDDNAQVIHMRFGVPAFNSMTTFFSGFYDADAARLARTGRGNGLFYYLGLAAGFVVSVMSWKLLAVHLLGVGARFLLNKPSSKFYYLKPAMPQYWNAVQTMVNHLAVNRGIIPRIGDPSQQDINGQYQFDAAGLQQLSKMLPDIIKPGGGIDVYSLAGKAQRLANRRETVAQTILDVANPLNLASNMNALSTAVQSVYTQIKSGLTDSKPSFTNYLESWFKANPSQPPAATTGTTGDASSTTQTQSTSDTEQMITQGPDSPAAAGFLDFLKNEFEDGTQFASFRVNSTGPMHENFSSTVGDTELQQKMNAMSSSSRSAEFNFAGGNIDDGVIGKMVGSVFGAVKDVVSGVAAGLNLSGLAALGGSAFVDIPKYWQSSTANLPRGNYTIELRSPYGNAVSQLLNLYIPLCMLIAGALPQSAGKQAYTSPLLLELYDRGRCQSRLAIIDSMSISRGVTNLGFNNAGHAMGIDVSFSVLDLSSIMAMPIAEGFKLTSIATGAVAGAVGGGPIGAVAGAFAASGAFDDDTAFSDYMAVLAGMGLADQIYQYRKLKLRLTQQMADFDSWFSASHFANFAGDTFPARMWSALYQGTSRN